MSKLKQAAKLQEKGLFVLMRARGTLLSLVMYHMEPRQVCALVLLQLSGCRPATISAIYVHARMRAYCTPPSLCVSNKVVIEDSVWSSRILVVRRFVVNF